MCQCPLGLIPHFYEKKLTEVYKKTNFGVNALSGLYLISTCTDVDVLDTDESVSMPSRAYTSFLHLSNMESYLSHHFVSMPSRAYTSFLLESVGRRNIIRRIVSMPSRAYTSFLRYPFKSLGFMRFSEPVFAGIYQNILTTAVFRAC